MARQESKVCTGNRFPISRQQFDSLLESHNAFHEVAIRITDILQDSSRVASYQPAQRTWQGKDLTPDAEKYDHATGQEDSNMYDNDPQVALPRKSHSPQYSAPQMFNIEKTRARKQYSEKRTRNFKMYARVSCIAAEYDFQYKFYTNDVYAELDDDPGAAGFDPWAWASKVPVHSDPDAYNAYYQLDHGQRLLEMVQERRSELMEALFPLRTSHTLQCMSWPELEYSYGLHLKDIINRLGFGKTDNAIGYFDSDITSMILEIGRFFTEIDYSNRPKEFSKGGVPNAIGPFANEPWSAETRAKYSLKELHDRCPAKNLMRDWQGSQILRLVFDSMIGSGRTDRQAEYVYILEAIFAISRVKPKGWPLRRPITNNESREFILEFLDKHVEQSEESLEQASEQVFAASELNIETLKSLGGLDIVWTDCIDDHLRLSINSRTLILFWDVSLLDQSLLFWYNARCLKMNIQNTSSSSSPQTHVLYELKTTHRLIFSNKSANHFTTLETCRIKDARVKQGIMVHDLRVDINSARAQRILKHFLKSPLPNKLRPDRPTNVSPQKLKHLFYPKPSPNTIAAFLATGPPYPLDLCWHLENILIPYPQFLGESEDMRSFAHFPRFGDRLWELKFYMDNQRPSGWYQMWKDKRDRVQHVTFWAVLFFGSISIVLALISVAVSSAQTVAAFRSVKGNG